MAFRLIRMPNENRGGVVEAVRDVVLASGPKAAVVLLHDEAWEAFKVESGIDEHPDPAGIWVGVDLQAVLVTKGAEWPNIDVLDDSRLSRDGKAALEDARRRTAKGLLQ